MVGVDWRGLVLVVVLGVCIGLVSGFFENPPSEVGIPEYKYYGYPLVWRVTQTALPDEFRFFDLSVDCLIWIAIVSVIAMFVWGSSKWMSRKNVRIYK